MSSFARSQPFLFGLFLLFAWIVLFLAMYDLIGLFWISRKKPSKYAGFVLLGVSFVFLQMLLMIQNGRASVIDDLPPFYALFAEILLLVLIIIQQIRVYRWAKNSLSSMSIKEALDSLPTGLLFFKEDGIPRLVNEQMNRICVEAFDMPLHNGAEFRDLVFQGSNRAASQTGDDQVFTLSDHVYQFSQNTLQAAGETYCELIASDITQEWELKRKLEEQQKKAKQINMRLKSLLDTIEYVTMSKELLQFKTTLHDNIGKSLLVAKRWILEPKMAERSEMLEIFRSNIRSLIQEEPEHWQTPYFIIEKQARQLGIELIVDGELPHEEASLVSLIDTAISTQMTNVLRHAEGKKVFVKVSRSEDSWILRLSNDGRAPMGKVTEKGGLSNLRREVQLYGGTMEIISEPAFELVLTLPEKSEKK